MLLGVSRLIANPLPLASPKRVKSKAPSLHRHYPASAVLRASPSPQTAQPGSRELPVDPTLRITAGASRVAYGPLCLHAVATTPAGSMEAVRSYSPTNIGLPRISGGSAPALPFSRPAQRSLTLRPACLPSRLCDPLHRRLQPLRYLYRCSDCYRVEPTSSRTGFAPAVVHTPFHGALRNAG